MRARAATLALATCCSAVAIAVAGCGSSSKSHSSTSAATSKTPVAAASSSSAKSPVSILWIGDTTGPAKLYGAAQLSGLQGAVAYYNAHGGIAGHHVVVHHVSDNVDPTTAVTELIQALQSSTPTMVWAGSIGTDAAALIPVLAKHNVFAIALQDGSEQCQTNAAVDCPNEWTLSDNYGESLTTASNWFVAKGFKKVGVLQETDTLSESETPLILKDLKAHGIATALATYPATATSVTPELQALESDHAQAVFFEGLGAPSGYALTARAALGWKVPMVFDVAGSSADLTKLAPSADVKDAYEDVYAEQDPSDKVPGIKAMLQYTKPYGNIANVGLDTPSTGWDAVVALDDAVKQAGGSLSVKSLDAAMLHLPPTDPLRTFTHKLGYTRSDHENVLAEPSDFTVIPAGPVIGGQVQSP
jgi:branched-chain amino acid transport system substrate-binding protein